MDVGDERDEKGAKGPTGVAAMAARTDWPFGGWPQPRRPPFFVAVAEHSTLLQNSIYYLRKLQEDIQLDSFDLSQYKMEINYYEHV